MNLKELQLDIWENDPIQFYRDIYKEDPYPYQEEVLQEIKKYPKIKRILICAAGGTGKTKLLACVALYLVCIMSRILNTPISLVIISGSKDQARNLYEYCRVALQDNEILASEVDGEPLISMTKLKNRSIIRAVPNSLKAIQGLHTDIVIIDEAVLAGNFIIRDAFRIVAQSDKDLIILSGTPMNQEGGELFIELFQDEDQYPEWKRFHWSAKDCPSISTEQYLEASKNLPEDMFSIFWEGEPYQLAGSLIPFDKLKIACKDIPIIKKDPNGGRIIGGIDWGWADPTAIVILQLPKDPEDKINILYIDQWRREQFKDLHDRIVQLSKEYQVEEWHTDASDVGENQRLEERGLNVIPIGFNQNKVEMQTNLKLIFHQERIRIPNEYYDLIKQLRKYNWDTKKGEDLIDALMLALYKTEEEGCYYYKIF